jgi:REase_DpnII-MboI
MVSVTDSALKISLSRQAGELLGQIRMERQSDSPDAALIDWFALRMNAPLPIDSEKTVPIPTHRWSEAPILAMVGYWLAMGSTDTFLLQNWLAGVEKLAQREVNPTDRNSFLFRPVELLGLALGAEAVAIIDVKPKQFLQKAMNEHSRQHQSASVLGATLQGLAAKAVESNNVVEIPIAKSTADYGVILCVASIAESDPTPRTIEHLCESLLTSAVTSEQTFQSFVERALIYLALQKAMAAALGSLTFTGMGPATFVATLCRRFPLTVGELSRRHAQRPAFQIKDEYDVQDLLRSLLRLHFDDIRPEEWNPSYGGRQSRSDLLLKAERVIIETKMTRKSLGRRELIDQLIIDKAQYRNHPDCGSLVCFVYDPEHRLTNPTAIETDLSDYDGPLRTVVVISPTGV